MRLRKKWYARPELEESPLFIKEPRELKGRWKEEFGNDNPIHLELGCGRGGFMVQKAALNPNINYVSVDLKDEVLIFAKRKIEEAELKNVRITALNISFIAEIFDKNEIEKIYINFCNPWPKDRHKKRRLTHTRQLEKYKKFLKHGAEIWFKTDDDELFEESLEYFKESNLEIKYITYDLHSSGFEGNVTTEHEEMFTAQGIKTKFLIAEYK